MALSQFGLSARIDRAAPDSDRHGLRPVRLPRARCADLWPLCRRAHDLRRNARRRVAQPGRRRAPKHRHALARHRIAGRALLRAGLRAGSRVDAARRDCPLRGPQSHGSSTYLRLSTKPVDQKLAAPITERIDPGAASPACPCRRVSADRLARTSLRNLIRATPCRLPQPGSWCPRPSKQRGGLHSEGVAANVLVITSGERLYADIRTARRTQLRAAGVLRSILGTSNC